MNRETLTTRRLALILLIGATLLVVSNGRWILPPATWIAPAFLLCFLERTRPLPGLVSVLAALAAVWTIAWRGMIPAPGMWYFLAAVSYAVFAFLPFLAHRLAAVRISGFHSTLVFPTAWVVTQYGLQQWVAPYGSWGALAYTQTEFPIFAQAASLGGVLTLDFFMTWFASVVAWLWTRRSNPAAWRAAMGWYGVLTAGLLAYGFARLSQPPAELEKRRIALITPDPQLATQLESAFAPALSGRPLTRQQLDALMEKAAALNDDLLGRSREAARRGADFVVWSETAGRVLPSTEPPLLSEAQRIARAHEAMLILGLGVWSQGTPPLENKIALVSGDASRPRFQHKAKPIFMAESTLIAAGTETIPVIETDGVRVGAVICHDMDFPSFLRQAGRARIDLMFAPSADWPEVARMHAGMASFRAIENGFALARPESGGGSAVFDARGRSVALAELSPRLQLAEIAASRSPTLYPIVGDALFWLCASLLAFLLWPAARGRAAN